MSADGGNGAIYTMEAQETTRNRRRTGEERARRKVARARGTRWRGLGMSACLWRREQGEQGDCFSSGSRGRGIGNHIPPQQDTPQQWTHTRILLMHYCHKRQVIIAAFTGGKYSRNTVHPEQLNRSNYEQNNEFKFHSKRINSSLPARSPFRF